MQAGVVDYKLCDRDYDCEHCPFDDVFHHRLAKPELKEVGSSSPLRKGRAGIHGWEVASGLFYHPGHVWARIEEGGCVRAGLDYFGQRLLGRTYLISTALPGSTVHAGRRCSVITHHAGVAVVPAPVSGIVKEVNQALAQQPALLNRDPYGAGWLLVIEPADLKSSLKQLLYGPKVSAWCERELASLQEKVCGLLSRESTNGPTMNDGGGLNRDFMNALSTDQLRQLIHSFFPLSPTEQANINDAILDSYERR